MEWIECKRCLPICAGNYLVKWWTGKEEKARFVKSKKPQWVIIYDKDSLFAGHKFRTQCLSSRPKITHWKSIEEEYSKVVILDNESMKEFEKQDESVKEAVASILANSLNKTIAKIEREQNEEDKDDTECCRCGLEKDYILINGEAFCLDCFGEAFCLEEADD